MKKLLEVLIAAVLSVIAFVLYLMFLNPVRIDKTCAGFRGGKCSEGFVCKIEPKIPGSTDSAGLCVPTHLSILPFKAFTYDPPKLQMK